MRKNVRKGLQRLLAMVLTFAMVIAYAGCIGTVEVRAEGYDRICKVKVVVKDKSTGEVIENAKVIFTGYYREGDVYPVREIERNEDGTYNVPYESEYDGTYYRYYATAPGYRDSRTPDYNGVLYGKKILVEGVEMTAASIQLEAYPYENQLQTAITEAQDEINKYVNTEDYDADQKAKIVEIRRHYLTRIEKEVQVETETAATLEAKKNILNVIVSAAKAEMDAVATSQDNTNEGYANCISFVPESGENKSLARKEYGKFEITLSRFEKGTFKINGNDADTKVSWDAKKNMLGNASAGSNYADYEIIDNKFNIGSFLSDKAVGNLADPSAVVGKIENCSVTFTKDGKPITVTFDLNIIARNIYGITVNAPKEVVLEKNEAGDAYKAVKYTAEVSSDDPDYTQKYTAEVSSDDPDYTQNITIESLTPEVAIVNEDKAIIPLKAGTAKFKATADGLEPVTFSIIFSSIDEVNALIKGIESLGEITLDNADAVEAARAAYDALSDVAKDKVTGLKTLENAEKKILELRTAAAEAAKAEAEKAKQEALDKAAAAEKAKQEALDKAAAAEAAKAEAERQAAAEKAAAEQSEAEKEAAEKAAAEAQAKAEAAEKAAAEEKARAEEAERAAAEKVAAAEKAAEEAKTAAQEAQKMAEEAVKSTLPNLTLKVKAGKKKATLSWKKANNVTGYIIYRSTKKNGGYEQVKVIKNAKTTKFTDKNLKSKKTYYYKICAYKGNVNGNLSAAKKVKVK